MAKPQVTITLGRSGQRVVKESWANSIIDRSNNPPHSGSKRPFTDSFMGLADHSSGYSKRIRDDVSGRSYEDKSHLDDSRLGPKDLRLKLMHKRISRCKELEKEEKKKMEMRERVSRAIQSLESPDHGLSRSTLSLRSTAEPPQVDSARSSYAAWASHGVRTRSPDMVMKYSVGMSTPRSAIDELPRVPSMRMIDASRSGSVLMRDSLEPSRPPAPLPIKSSNQVYPGKLVAELPLATGSMSKTPYPENQPLTVSSLLNSLGLGKYYIHFQAEEIDMVALKQMGDLDLKELGVPMGPRKKILLALQARTKRPVTQVPSSSYVQ